MDEEPDGGTAGALRRAARGARLLPRTHHLGVCGAGSEHEFRHIAVRDFLRAHDDAAARYEALKRHVVAHDPQDRLADIEGKEEFMAALEARALDWARARR
jgi:GrpB-like predicted nucleotidyltransferase (UPF0157 family)